MDSNVQPADFAIRERFAHELDRNFSMICPAGSGKTHTTVERIVAYAVRPDAVRVLPKLVVVTFTKRSAEEMQQRAREALCRTDVSGEVQSAFSQAFFGTIHSWAVNLLRQHGYLIGVPSVFEVTDAQAGRLWVQFIKDPTTTDKIYANPLYRAALRHLSLETIYDMALAWDLSRACPTPDASVPAFDLTEIFNFPLPKRKDTAANIEAFKREVAHFVQILNGGDVTEFAPLPVAKKGGEEFKATCQRVLAPVASWLRAVATCIAGEVVTAFRGFRLRSGVLSYDDQINFAVDLLKNDVARNLIRGEGYIVLLDEAQDTDPAQFDLLVESVRPVEASGSWRNEGAVPPAPGRFCMVGDLQQSIYGSRADLPTYEQVHRFITESVGGEALVFKVTFRCDKAIIDMANKTFPSILTGTDGQVGYVPLFGRPAVGAGQVVRLKIDGAEDPAATDADLGELEADRIASFLSLGGPERLGAKNWGSVAIICPRTRWFVSLRSALLRKGISSVYLSQSESNSDSPAYLWLTAMLTIVTDPRNSFEIVGVLRDIFGVSDRALGFFSKGRGERFQIVSPTEGEGEVEAALTELNSIYRAVASLPLRSAVSHLDEHVLRFRLRSLNACTFGDQERVMDTLLAKSAEMEARGVGQFEFAELLRAELLKKPEPAKEDASSVTILTNLKCKGLQWDAVIVPYFFREITTPPIVYPRMIGNRYTTADFALSKEDAATHDAKQDVAEFHELQRLLYVLVTRAKKTLVIADDSELFAAGGIPAYSLANAFLVDGANRETWDSLPGDLCEAPAAPVRSRPTMSIPASIDFKKASEFAAQFPEKIAPHSLASGSVAEEPEARIENPLLLRTAGISVQYGIWWHETMNSIPWPDGRTAWNTFFGQSMIVCPDPDRAQLEWGLFLQSSLATILEQARIVLKEAPFGVPLVSGQTLEGVMDLAILPKNTDRWLITDWKTGDATLSPEEIYLQYEPQLEGYRLALEATIGAAVDKSVFATAAGELFPAV